MVDVVDRYRDETYDSTPKGVRFNAKPEEHYGTGKSTIALNKLPTLF